MKLFWRLISVGPVYNQGINRERVEQMEDRLKEDILMEAER